MLRSSAPAILLAAGAALAIGGFVGWKVVGQANAIHRAEATAPAVMTSEPSHATTQNAVVLLPSDGTAAPVSQVATTGATVPAPIATTVAAAPVPVAVSPLPPVKAEPPAPKATLVTAPSHRTPARRQEARKAAAAPSDDDNPYDDGTASKPTPAPADVFAPKQ